MKLEEMKKIADARTKGKWKHDWGNHDIEIPYPNRSESLLQRGDDGNYNANLEFAAMAANNWDKLIEELEYYRAHHMTPLIKVIEELKDKNDMLMAVVEAAKAMSNLYVLMKDHEASTVSPKTFFNLMQKYCNEYGALQITLKALEDK